jgi:hypothetical protein
MQPAPVTKFCSNFASFANTISAEPKSILRALSSENGNSFTILAREGPWRVQNHKSKRCREGEVQTLIKMVNAGSTATE